MSFLATVEAPVLGLVACFAISVDVEHLLEGVHGCHVHGVPKVALHRLGVSRVVGRRPGAFFLDFAIDSFGFSQDGLWVQTSAGHGFVLLLVVLVTNLQQLRVHLLLESTQVGFKVFVGVSSSLHDCLQHGMGQVVVVHAGSIQLLPVRKEVAGQIFHVFSRVILDLAALKSVLDLVVLLDGNRAHEEHQVHPVHDECIVILAGFVHLLLEMFINRVQEELLRVSDVGLVIGVVLPLLASFEDTGSVDAELGMFRDDRNHVVGILRVLKVRDRVETVRFEVSHDFLLETQQVAVPRKLAVQSSGTIVLRLCGASHVGGAILSGLNIRGIGDLESDPIRKRFTAGPWRVSVVSGLHEASHSGRHRGEGWRVSRTGRSSDSGRASACSTSGRRTWRV